MILLGLVLQLGLHPVAIAHLSPGTRVVYNLVSEISTGEFTDCVGMEYNNVIPLCHMFY
jgi:hypothetical protein